MVNTSTKKMGPTTPASAKSCAEMVLFPLDRSCRVFPCIIHSTLTSDSFFDTARPTSRFRSDHVAHVRGACGVGVDHVLEIARPQAHADREGEEVDDLLGVQAQQVRPQNAV